MAEDSCEGAACVPGMPEAVVGIDAGTTAIKSVAYTPDGEVLAQHATDNPVESPAPGHSEQDPRGTWERTCETIRAVTAALSDEVTVAAVGVTSQGGGCWFVNDGGEPVGNAIIWTDGRAAGIVDGWRESATYEQLFEQFGYGVFPGQALPILQWLGENDPDRLDRIGAVVSCKDWLVSRLTGRVVSDPTAMSIGHYDAVAGAFAADLPEEVSIPGLAAMEPEVLDPLSVIGGVTGAAAGATGLPEGVPVIAGTFDVAASALGSGVVRPGDTSAVVGTTLQIQRLLDEPRIEPPPVGYTLGMGVGGMGLRAMGAMTGTPNIDWARETLAGGADFETIESEARSAPPGAGGLVYHPYLSDAGEKAPFVDPDARAGFTGLEPSHSRGHLLRAVYEGIALALRDCAEHLPGTSDRVVTSGGGVRSEFWCRLFADCLDATVAVPAGDELGARGIAAMAATATGLYAEVEAAVDAMTSVETSYEPRPERVARYEDLYEVYADAREGLREAWTGRAAAVDGWEIDG